MSREQVMRLAEAVRDAVINAWKDVDAPEGRSDISRLSEELESMESVDLSAIIAALLPDLAQQAKDAARYRYLRRKEAWKEHNLHVPGSVGAVFVASIDGCGYATDGEELDNAIDVAMKEYGHD